MASVADSIPKLVLHPKQPLVSNSDRAGVVDALRSCGLIGADFQAGGVTHYRPGEHFLDLVVFLGCSPAVALEPTAGAEPVAAVATFCNVRVDGPLAQTRFRPGVAAVAPRCPSCRASVDDWQRLVHNGRASGEERWRCSQCETAVALHALNWRHNAGFGRMFVDIWGIHPHEAVPADALMTCLHEHTDEQWTYCYSAA